LLVENRDVPDDGPTTRCIENLDGEVLRRAERGPVKYRTETANLFHSTTLRLSAVRVTRRVSKPRTSRQG